ncbi:MAG: 3-hydroxyacyl-CoA dehydrogenase NAD-binding domain-containing protein [Ignavibacteriales bacterium]|nr:3-hydroxyacyl-CoA dehydrogenase NAD-binding domain-containing protein [Ignavibacteriales bacterium]
MLKTIIRKEHKMDIKKVAVVGGGTMGNGIAHVFALKEFQCLFS